MNRNRPSTLELKAAQKKIRENVQKYGNAFTLAENQGQTENL